MFKKLDTAEARPWLNSQNKEKYDDTANIRCSAGSNYFVVKSNGAVCRCFHDMSPMGDMLDFPSFRNAVAEHCRVGYICDPSGDQMFSTQWNYRSKFNNSVPGNPVCTNWIESKDPNQVKTNRAYVVIYPTMACNFRCPYCCNFYPQDGNPRPNIARERSTNDWVRFLEILSQNSTSPLININGGEPLLRHDIAALIDRMLDLKIDCSMVTNLSVSKSLDSILALPARPEKLKITATLHPANPQFDAKRSLEYVLRLHNEGHRVRVVVLGWPDNIKFHEQYKNVYRAIGIDYWLKWCGGYNHPKDFVEYLHGEGATKPTPVYLREIGWCERKIVPEDEFEVHVDTDNDVHTSIPNTHRFTSFVCENYARLTRTNWHLIPTTSDDVIRLLGAAMFLKHHEIEACLSIFPESKIPESEIRSIMSSIGIDSVRVEVMT